MSPEKSPFPCGWPGSELEGYRQPPRESAVSWFPYETLPPLPGGLFRGDFQWLASQPLRSNLADHQIESRRDYLDEMALAGPVKLSALRTAAGQLGLSIPPPFFTFMGDSDLIGRLCSSTDCLFELSERVAANPKGGGYLVHFLSDFLDGIYWNLFVTVSGDHCVVASREYFGDPSEVDDDAGDDLDDLVFCAPSFESFVYRFWLENEIWYQLSWRRKPLTPLQQRYVDHYRDGETETDSAEPGGGGPWS